MPDSTELRVLRQLYNATNGPGWGNRTNWPAGGTSWPAGTTLAQAATWYGVGVSGGDVANLYLQHNGLVGPLPSDVGKLRGLVNLYLHNNQLTGPIPASLGNLANLQYLVISYNAFSGSLPPALGQIAPLRYLVASFNQLTGPLPATYGNLSQLDALDVRYNQLSGTLPPSLGQLGLLTNLSLNNNQFTGSIPAEYGNLRNCLYFYLFSNQLTGAIPNSLGKLTKAGYIYLYNNQLSGSLPVELSQLTAVGYLRLSNNQLSGTLPPALGQLQILNNLELNNNQLTGEVPSTYTRMNNLQLENNQLIGLPSWRNGPAKSKVWMGNNTLDFGALEKNFTGPGQPLPYFTFTPQRTPPGTDTVRYTPGDTLRLVRGLGGKQTHYQWERQEQQQWQTVAGATDSMLVLPAAEAEAQGLYRVKATNSWVTTITLTSRPVYAQATINAQLQALRELYESTDGDHWVHHENWPSGDSAWKSVRSLSECQTWYGLWVEQGVLKGIRLSNNHLRGELPASIGQLRDLDYLLLRSNELLGLLPYSLGDLSQLTYLFLDHNQFTGYIPPTLGQLPVLELALHSNRLTGPVPAELGQLSRVESLYLMDNELTGPFPAFVSQLTQLQYLYLGNNRLTGTVPTGLGQLVQLKGLGLNGNLLAGSVPASLTQLPLQELYLHGNAFTDLPSWVGAAQVPADFYVHNNLLSFAPLEKNFRAAATPVQPNFYYLDQRTPPGVDTVYFVRGTSPLLTRSIGGAHNVYQWERKQGPVWMELPGITGTSYPVANASEQQEGEYRVKVTNTWVTGLTLYSRPVYLSQLPYTPPPYNEPEANCQPLANGTEPLGSGGLPDSVNYVRTYVARQAFTEAAALFGAGSAGAQVKTEYLDGLGRPVQTVLRQESTTGRDLVQPMEYDELGRQAKQYLPYSAGATSEGSYRPDAVREQYRFYRGTEAQVTALTATLPKTNVAFSETVFEASPLNRPALQASAGESWSKSSGNAVTLEERPNTLADSVQRWIPGFDTNREDLLVGGAYPAGELWVKRTRDEQGQWAQEFTDKGGHVVLKQVGLNGTRQVEATQWLKTYYVYDDFGRLRAVLPPKAVQLLRKNTQGAWRVEGTGVERLLFRYHYDAQGRLVEKKVPDQDGYQYTLYDELDRPILSQDVAQQVNKEWVVTKYDALGRVVYTALIRFPGLNGTPSQQRDQLLQQQAAMSFAPLWEETSPTATLAKAQYTHNSFPDITQQAGAQLLTVSYYDSYDFNQDGQADAQYQAPTTVELACAVSELPQVDLRVTGQPTRSLVRVLGVDASLPEAWLMTTSFFDEKLRPIQVQSTNARGGTELVSTRYDFTGKALASYAVHQVPGQPTRRVREQSANDHAGRLLSVTQELDGATPQVLARHHYNELGQLEQKQLGGSLAATGAAVTPPLFGNGPKALQLVDYRYNIRGWLTQINDVKNPLPASAQEPEDLWSFSLSYDCGFNTPQFNGNIAGQTWRSASDGIERAYGYRYDNVNRLLQGDYVARASTSPTSSWSAERNNYRFAFASYDAGGNLLTLRRRGLVQAATRTSPAQYAETDNLRYRYDPAAGSEPGSNRLQRVDDQAPAATAFGSKLPERPDFSDGTTSGATTPDYTYDVAGSLLSDKNKGITRITYNYLHLPETIEWSSGNTLQYVYTATGQKVAKVATTAAVAGKPTPAPVRTDYLGAWQYERDTLRWLNHAEGRALLVYRRDAANQVLTKYRYEYTLKDHLGNLRVAFHPGERTTYRAFLDSDPTQMRREQHEFDSVSVSAPIRQSVGMQFAHGGDGVALLNAGGAQPRPLGPLKQLAVAKNDTLIVSAFGMYQQKVSSSSTWGFSLAGFVASLLQQQPATMPMLEGSTRVRVLPLLSAGLTAATLPALQQLAGGVPQAYLRVLVFNSDSVLVANQPLPQQLTAAAEGGYQPLQLTLVVPQAGYVQAYVANESDTDVFFDDITVEHRQGLQVQENQYDPFGLDLAGLSSKATPENKYTFNGKEKQTEFGLNWHDHGWRFYDPTLGRWVVSDPDAEEVDQESWGTYQFGLDNAVRYNDLDGRAPGGPGDNVPTLAGTLYNTAAGLAVSGINTVMSLGQLIGPNAGISYNMPTERAELGEDGQIHMSLRLPATSGKELLANAASDGLDIVNFGSLFIGGGAGKGLTTGAGMLMAKTGSTTVIANTLTSAGKKALTVKEQYVNLVAAATQKAKGNVTVRRNGQDLFRVHQPQSGHGIKVTQFERRSKPGGGNYPATGRDVPVRKKHVEQLKKAGLGAGSYDARKKNNSTVQF